MNPPTEQLIRDYLNRVSVAARGRLGAEDRRAFVSRTREFIEQNSRALGPADSSTVLKLLAGLGDPAGLVDRECDRLAAIRAGSGGDDAPAQGSRAARAWRWRPARRSLTSLIASAAEVVPPGQAEVPVPEPAEEVPLTGELSFQSRPISSRWKPGAPMAPREPGMHRVSIPWRLHPKDRRPGSEGLAPGQPADASALDGQAAAPPLPADVRPDQRRPEWPLAGASRPTPAGSAGAAANLNGHAEAGSPPADGPRAVPEDRERGGRQIPGRSRRLNGRLTGTEPRVTEPRVTEPRETEPRETEANGTESGGTEPGGTEARGTQAGGTQAGGTEAGGTEARGTGPRGPLPGETDSSAASPNVTGAREPRPPRAVRVVWANGVRRASGARRAGGARRARMSGAVGSGADSGGADSGGAGSSGSGSSGSGSVGASSGPQGSGGSPGRDDLPRAGGVLPAGTLASARAGAWRFTRIVAARARRHPLEATAVVLLGLGGVIYPPVWLMGAAVALVSRIWDFRDKWVGLAVPVFLVIVGMVADVSLGGPRHELSAYVKEAWMFGGHISRIAALLGAVYLAWRAERGRRPPTVPPWNKPHRIG